jgi:uncharacterized membrane protein YedE/YeeE
MKRALTAFGSGLLFGIGLCLSGMIDPRKVVGFLDVFGAWNPSLAAVMIGAIGVHASLLRLFRGRDGAAKRSAPGSPGIDGRLVLGSAIFGVGWGLGGYCPGPAIVSLGFGAAQAVGFLAAMLLGARLGEAAVSSSRQLVSRAELGAGA